MTDDLKKRVEESLRLDSGNCTFSRDVTEEMQSIIKELKEREDSLIAGIEKCMEVLETEAPDTIFMGNKMLAPTMWDYMANLIDFEAEKQIELPIDDVSNLVYTPSDRKTTRVAMQSSEGVSINELVDDVVKIVTEYNTKKPKQELSKC